MRKRILLTTLAVISAAGMLTGCGHGEPDSRAPSAQSSSVSSSEAEEPMSEEELLYAGSVQPETEADITSSESASTTASETTAPDGLPIADKPTAQCASLKTEGITVEYEKQADVTDEEARTACLLDETDLSEVGSAGETVKEGDTVTLSLTARTDGQTDDSLTQIHTSYGIGSGLLGHALEQGLIGAEDGTERIITVSYPETDTTADRPGQTVEYTVVVEGISRPASPSKDEITSMKQTLQEARDATASEAYYAAAKEALVNQMTVQAYPESLVQTLRAEYEKPLVSQYGSVRDYLDQSGMTRKEFKSAETESVFSGIKTKMLFELLGDLTHLTKSSPEYKAKEASLGAYEDDPDEWLFEARIDAALKDAAVRVKTAAEPYEGETVSVKDVPSVSQSQAEAAEAEAAKASDTDSFPETTY